MGHNTMIDLFKQYASENSYKILIADSIMIASTVILANILGKVKKDFVVFGGLLGVYALTYIIHTH
jgi:hypothetical protein